MKIAYIVSAYKYPGQLIRLIHRLNTDTSSFFVHIDKKTEEAIYRQMVSKLSSLQNVYFLRRHKCYWGGFGHVRATLEGIYKIFDTAVDFDYAILLTGQDYPIKSNNYIDTFFRKHNGKLFMNYFSLPCESWQNRGVDRIEAWHVRFFHRHFRFPKTQSFPVKRKFPRAFQPFGGSSYWCLPRECVEYIYTFIKQNGAFVRFFKYVDVPDEIFFQTIILNSPFKRSVVNDDLRYIDWKDPYAGSPAVLCEDDFEKIVSSPKLFARKFDMTIDAEVLDMIDQKILIEV